VTLRLTTTRARGGYVVAIDGRLDTAGLDELERVVAGLSGAIRLELAGLRSLDPTAREALRALRARGISLTGASPYFRLLLGRARRRKSRDPPSPPAATPPDQRKRRGRSARRQT